MQSYKKHAPINFEQKLELGVRAIATELAPEMQRLSADPESRRGRADHYESTPDMIQELSDFLPSY